MVLFLKKRLFKKENHLRKTVLITAAVLSVGMFQVFPLSGGEPPQRSADAGASAFRSAVLVDSIAPDHSGMRNLNSFELSQEMVPGWNVGNSLEAIGGETAWGNPKITQRLIDSVKAAGFKSVRIPVAWSRFTDQATFTIDPAWLNRVAEVVDYVLKDSMYAMINEHWDNGWVMPTYTQQEYVNNRLAAMWRQIAVRFRDYDDHLIFAGTNEVHVDYNAPTVEYYTVQNGYNQTFVNTVRSTGGRNAYRYLAVQGFNTNIDYTNRFFVMPADAEQSRLLVEVHYYDPYNFTINTNSTITQWGKYATNPAKTETWANESWADAQFKKMKIKFIDKGYGVLLGEYGTIARLSLGSTALNKEHASYRVYWTQYITRSLERHGLVPMYWDNGGTGDKGMGIFNRSTGAKAYPDIVKAVVDTSSLIDAVRQPSPSTQTPATGALLQNYPNPFNPTTLIRYTLPGDAAVLLEVYDALGRRVRTLVDERQLAGEYSALFDASGLAGGLYLCQLQTDSWRANSKMLLIR
jgi:endoglucanase